MYSWHWPNSTDEPAVVSRKWRILCHILVALQSWLWKEVIDHCLGAAAVSHMKDDIIGLIKATGNCPPVLAGGTTLLALLDNHLVMTDRAKTSLGEASLRDLGLLHDKVKFEQPVIKAERSLPLLELEAGMNEVESESLEAGMASQDSTSMEVDMSAIESESDCNAVGLEAGTTAQDSAAMGAEPAPELEPKGYDTFGIPHMPKGMATPDEYRCGMLAVNAVSLRFCHGNLNKLCSKEEDAAVPIGMRLLKE